MSNPRAAPPVLVMNGRPALISANFTRPADTTQYAANDLVANSTTAGSVVPMTFSGVGLGQNRQFSVLSAVMRKTSNTLTVAQFKLHLFKVIPTVTNGDNGAFSIATQGDKWIGSLSGLLNRQAVLPANSKAMGYLTPDDGLGAIDGILEAGATDLFGIVEAIGAYTPASAEVLTFELNVLQY